ncbi:MAG: FAD-dependent monooxygenase [Verrucomicrobia bacterium]|nr:FAD-dependent monooxygenase [Verrucomicrobiota bacterium]MBS0646149.1 FAD-dependent monooxygenase [Verrucomicrobiota bacterium]
MRNQRILISGAGPAGLTLAYWLRYYGFSPTLVERSPSLRIGGYKVDIRGVALEVVKYMGLYGRVKDLQTNMLGASVVDKFGQEIAQMNGDTFNLRISQDLEIIRGDLCRILAQQIEGMTCLFNDSVVAISQGHEGVEVEFENHAPQQFDLVIGADGLHSTVRKLVFGHDSCFAKELGLYISIFSVPNALGLHRWEMEYADSTKLVNLYSPSKDQDAKAAFLFASQALRFDIRDVQKQQQLLSEVYVRVGWEVPKLLAAMKQSKDFYFDSIAQICMSHWSDGRVALVGDAGYCPSPVSGQGTSLALVGAYVLAGELALAKGDYAQAFSQYEKQLRKYVEQNQKLGRNFAKNMTEGHKKNLTVWLHDQFMRLLPGRWIKFVTKQATRRVGRAANAVVLKNYTALLNQ